MHFFFQELFSIFPLALEIVLDESIGMKQAFILS